jgi:hypothetical protein
MIALALNVVALWAIYAALLVTLRYLPAAATGADWDWWPEIRRSLRPAAIFVVAFVAAAQLHYWSPGLFWLGALLLAGRVAWRAVRRRQRQPAAAQWTEDQLP